MAELLELKLQREKKPRKKLDRTVYIALTNAMGWTLCGFCRYCSGGCESPFCKHPLDKQKELMNDIEPGFDCWGFRPEPRYTVEDYAEIAGTYIEKGWEVCAFEKRDDGMIEMTGADNWF